MSLNISGDHNHLWIHNPHWIPQNSLVLLQLKLNCCCGWVSCIKAKNNFPKLFWSPHCHEFIGVIFAVHFESGISKIYLFAYQFFHTWLFFHLSILFPLKTENYKWWTVHHSAGLWISSLMTPGHPKIILKFLGRVKKRETKDKRVRLMFLSENSIPP